jgi:hypothetical protein
MRSFDFLSVTSCHLHDQVDHFVLGSGLFLFVVVPLPLFASGTFGILFVKKILPMD